MIPQRIGASQTLALNQKVKELKAKGEDIVSFAAGESDFESPEWVIEAAYESMKKGNTKYVASQGIASFRESLSADMKKRLNCEWLAPEHVLVTGGAKPGILLILNSLLDPGDEVMIPAPYWVSYPGIVKSVRGESVFVETKKEDSYFPTCDALEKAKTPKTKALVMASPNNPTGGMIDLPLLKETIAWCQENKVLLIFDELYERLVFGDKKHVSPLSLLSENEMEWVVCVNALSKAFSMTGWRVGCLISHPENIRVMTAMQSQLVTCVPGFLQEAGITALDRADEYLEPVLASFKERRGLFMEEISKVPNVEAFPPEAAFYVLIDVRPAMKKKSLADDKDFAAALLEEQKVAVTPGSSFGMPGYLRFTFALKKEDIIEGISRLSRFVS